MQFSIRILIRTFVCVKKLIWIYSDIHSCNFVDTNIFGHSFVSKFSLMSHSDTDGDVNEWEALIYPAYILLGKVLLYILYLLPSTTWCRSGRRGRWWGGSTYSKGSPPPKVELFSLVCLHLCIYIKVNKYKHSVSRRVITDTNMVMNRVVKDACLWNCLCIFLYLFVCIPVFIYVKSLPDVRQS